MIAAYQFARKREKKGKKLSVALGLLSLDHAVRASACAHSPEQRRCRRHGHCAHRSCLGASTIGAQRSTAIDRRRQRCAQHPTLQPSATRRGRSDDATRPSAQSLASAQAHNIAALILNPFDCTMMTAALSAIDQPAAPPAVASPAPHRPHSFTAMSTVRQRDIKVSSTVKRNRRA